ncbi:DNA-processing protein DprA [Streptomyces mirabilis]|uniref:DNA-processing protein DprA n=1 Tax=Streptomyces mirabilis TaxID=68239 RepID=UPI0036ABF1C5
MSDRADLAALSAHFPRPGRRRPCPVLPGRGLAAACPPRQHRPPGPVPTGSTNSPTPSSRAGSCRFLIPSDAQWPAALADLGSACPLGLWVRGYDRLPELTASTVVVTGNRMASTEVTDRAKAFTGAGAEAGHTVAANLAYGFDATAHEAAELIGGITLAVLPRGLDHAYPHTHAPLLNSVTDNGGAAVSLYRPGTEISGATLKASAALLAALSRTVILIEALDHTEALRTAEAALALKRTLLAVPSDGGIRSEGNGRLLAEHQALPCPDPARALELL